MLRVGELEIFSEKLKKIRSLYEDFGECYDKGYKSGRVIDQKNIERVKKTHKKVMDLVHTVLSKIHAIEIEMHTVITTFKKWKSEGYPPYEYKIPVERWKRIIDHYDAISKQFLAQLEETIKKDVKESGLYDEAFRRAMSNRLKDVRKQMKMLRRRFIIDIEDK